MPPGLGFLFAAVGATTVGAIALKIGAVLLLSAISRALMPKASAPTLGDSKTMIREPVSPCQVVYGKTRKSGALILIENSPGNTKVLHLIIAVAYHQVNKIGAIYFNDEKVVEDGQTVGIGKYSTLVKVERTLGSPNSLAFPLLRSTIPSVWTVAHQLKGCAAIAVSLTYSQDVFTSGLPNITVDIEGKNDIFDPRTGLRGYTTNAALCIADFMSSDFCINAKIGEIDGINEESLIESADICDEDVLLANSSTEKRFTCNGVISLDVTHEDNINQLLTSMAGSAIHKSGQWFLKAAYYQTPEISINESDIHSGFSASMRNSRSDNFNSIRGKFISPENGYVVDDFPPYVSDFYISEDNNEKVFTDIELPFTSSATMAQRICKIILEETRKQITVSFRGKLSCLNFSVGDTILLSKQTLGFVNKPFIVKNMKLVFEDNQLLVDVVLRETSPLVYDWSASEEQIYIASPPTNFPSSTNIIPPGIISVSEDLYKTRNGDGVKAKVIFEVSEPESNGVISYEIQASTDGIEWRTVYFGLPSPIIEVFDFTPGEWLFRARAYTFLGVRSNFSSIFPRNISGLGAIPSPITGLSIQSAGGLARLKWNPHPDLDVIIGGKIVIRHGAPGSTEWINSVFMDEISGASTQATLSLMPGVYMLRAKDSSGILGPVVMITTEASTILEYSDLGLIQEDDEFSGINTNTFNNAGKLQLSAGGLFSEIPLLSEAQSIAYPDGVVETEGIYEFSSILDLGIVKSVRVRRQIDVMTIKIFDKLSQRSGTISSWPSFSGTDIAAGNVITEISVTNDDPSGSPVWSSWQVIESSEITTRAIKARARLTTENTGYTPSVSQLRILTEGI